MPDLYKLVEEGEEVWVTNNTGGKIILEIKRPFHNETFSAMIPPISDYPILIDAIVPRPILKEDIGSLFGWVRRGSLTLWDPKKAREFYSGDEDLFEAVDNLVKEANTERRFDVEEADIKSAPGAVERAQKAYGKKSPNEVLAGLDDEEDDEEDPSLLVSTNKDEVSPKVMGLVASLLDDRSRMNDVFIKLKTLDKRLLNDASLGYIITECADFSTIVKWAQDMLVQNKEKRRSKKRKKNRK